MKNTRILFRKLAYGCLLLLCTGCLHENPELTEDGEMGVDPTSVILNANLNINLDFTLLEEADTRATENDIQQRITIAAFLDGEEVKREVIYQKVVTGRNQLNIPVSMKLHARLYQIVAWVDYENKNDSKGPYYITDNLTSLLCSDSYRANTDYRDAYYACTELDLRSYRDKWGEEISLDLNMIRPLARYELVANDLPQLRRMIADGKTSGNKFTVKVEYNYYLPTGMNLLTGKVGHSKQYVTYSRTVTLPTDEEQEELQLAYDYVMVNGEGSFVSVNIEIADAGKQVISRVKGLQVSYEQGHLTTKKGKFFSVEPNPGISIDTEFDEDIIIDLDRPFTN